MDQSPKLCKFCGLLLLITTVTGWASAKAECGYFDKTGKLVIPPQFAGAGWFSEGLAVVRTETNGKYGYIDKTRNVVIHLSIRMPTPFPRGELR